MFFDRPNISWPEVYNLGFGDYDPEIGEIEDDILSGNGDPYRVFNTVLNCVSLFFETNRKAVLLVAGSDSSQDFVEKCRTNCSRNCKEGCKKQHRRIRAYCNFIRKNFKELCKNLSFHGGIIFEDRT